MLRVDVSGAVTPEVRKALRSVLCTLQQVAGASSVAIVAAGSPLVWTRARQIASYRSSCCCARKLDPDGVCWLVVLADQAPPPAIVELGLSAVLGVLRQAAIEEGKRPLLATAPDAAEALDHVSSITKTGSWTLDPGTGELHWSRETLRIHEVPDGFVPDLDNAVGFYLPEGRVAIEAAIEEAIMTGEPWDLELPLRTWTGRDIWVRAMGRADTSSGSLRLYGTFQDISDQVATRTELIDMASRLKEALAHADAYREALDRHAIVATTDARGIITFANDRFCEISGYDREELIGKDHRILNSGTQDKAFFVNLWRTIGKGQSWHGEICNRAKDGTLYWVDTTIVPLCGSDGRPERYVSVRYDITERKTAEALIEAAHERMKGFFDIAFDGLAVNGPDGRYVATNPAFDAITGHSPEELEGTGFVRHIHPDDLDVTFEAIDALKRDGAVECLINRYRQADGSWRHLEWRARRHGKLSYTSVRDITERVEKEAELLLSRKEAEAATEAKSVFLANMGHEIRTPLNGISGIAAALARTDLSPRQREMVDLVRGSGATLERLLNDLLDLSKIEAGRFELSPAPFELKAEIEAASALMRIKADDKGIGFALTFDGPAAGRFMGDAVRLRQIVTNLASNAIKFTEHGGVQVCATVDGDGADTVLTLEVRDTGIGFTEEVGQRLFGRFEQASDTTAVNFGGTGLGLSICKALAELMGGTIAATSIPGKGSTFTVKVPLARVEGDDAEADQGDAMELDALDMQGIRLLVVDDHAVNRKVAAMILEPVGFDLSFACDGEEALSMLDVQRFDAVLMDMRMPVRDGLSATAEWRSREAARGLARTPIAMLSANALPEHIAQAQAAGCDGHIAKPVTAESLLGGLVDLLAGQAAAQKALAG